jgi:hypothetical protein
MSEILLLIKEKLPGIYLWYAIIPSGSVTNWNDWAECGVTLPDPEAQIRDKY